MNTTTEVTELARCNDISPVRVLLGLMRAADKLSTADLAAVRVVAGALSSVTGSELLWRADSAAGLEQARAELRVPALRSDRHGPVPDSYRRDAQDVARRP